MKTFEIHHFDPQACQEEMKLFRTLLDTIKEPKEKEHLLPLFKQSPNLTSLIGSYALSIGNADKIAYELSIAGDFSCDVVVGDSRTQTYCFVELEDAGANSLFKRNGNKATRDWSPRFEHGFSQMVDWFYKLSDIRQTSGFENLFGRQAKYTGLLLIGRNDLLEPEELTRLRWRVDKVLVDSNKVFCVPFDELYYDLEYRLQKYTSATQPASD